MSANFGKWDMSTVASERRDGDKIEILKLQEGRSVLRFLPPQSGAKSPFVKVWQHYVNDPHENRLHVFPCPARMWGKSCPVCDHANKLSRTGNKADRERAYQLWPKVRVYSEVVDMNNEGAGVQVFAFGKRIYEDLLAVASDEDAGGDFTDVEEGFNIIIERSGTGKFDTSYKVFPSRRVEAFPDMGLLDLRVDLSRFTTAAPEKTLIAAQEAIGLPVTIEGRAVPKLTNIADDMGIDEDDDVPF